MLELTLKTLLAYLVGSLVGSLLIGRLTGVDIRALGSGNAGATNALRTQGKKIGLTVLIIDLAKGWIATGLLARATLPVIMPAPQALEAWSVALCGIAVMLGHVYPLWFGFRGGKGVATLVGALLGISLSLLLAFVLVWLGAVIALGYVGLASMLGACAVLIAASVSGPQPRAPLVSFAAFAALLILYTHRGNIARMRAHTESRARKFWLLGARRT